MRMLAFSHWGAQKSHRATPDTLDTRYGCAHHGPLSVRAGPNPFSKTSYIRNINDLCGDASGRKLLALPWQALRSTRKAGTRAAWRAYYLYGAPGTQKTCYIYVRQGIHSLDLPDKPVT